MKNQNLQKFSRSFSFLAVSLSIAAFLIMQLIWFLNRDKPYPATFNITGIFLGYGFIEFDKHPFPYMLSINFISALIGALWTVFFVPKFRKGLFLQILIIPWVSLFVVSPLLGLIYSIHLRSPKVFGSKEMMWYFYRTDALDGLEWGWVAALQSFPINILSYIAFCVLLFVNIRLLSNKNGFG